MMSDTSKYIEAPEILSFFKLLNDSNINYVLIKNVGGELPYNLKDGKDIDILVKLEDRPLFVKTMLKGGFLKRIPPLGREAGWKFGYQLPEYQFWQKRGIAQNFYIDCCFKLMCKSLTPNYWIPLDISINERIWKNKVWDDDLGCWRIDDKTLFPYLIARCVLDKKEFKSVYVKDINERLQYLDDDEVQAMLSTIFYRFTPMLTELLKAGRYDEIISKYISFKDY